MLKIIVHIGVPVGDVPAFPWKAEDCVSDGESLPMCMVEVQEGVYGFQTLKGIVSTLRSELRVMLPEKEAQTGKKMSRS